MRQVYNVDLDAYRRRFLARRVAVRMRARRVGEVQAYGDLLRTDPDEYQALLEELNINLSYFMRDQPAYAVLAEEVLPALIAAQRARGERRITALSAGCATGEEPYSLAILLDGALGADRSAWHIRIDAVDRSSSALALAQRGVYRSVNFQDFSAPYIEQYFSRVDNSYHISPAIRAMVSWQMGDIGLSPPGRCYDLILCRNVLIYYVRDRQMEILQHLLRHLAPDGYLMLGMAEMLPDTAHAYLSPVNAKVRIYRGNPQGKEGS